MHGFADAAVLAPAEARARYIAARTRLRGLPVLEPPRLPMVRGRRPVAPLVLRPPSPSPSPSPAKVKRDATLNILVGLVCELYSLLPSDVCGPSRNLQVCHARAVGMFMAVNCAYVAVAHAGEHFGGRWPASAYAAVKRITARFEYDEDLRFDIALLTRRLDAKRQA